MSPTGLGPIALLSGLGLVVRGSAGGFDSTNDKDLSTVDGTSTSAFVTGSMHGF